jgi:hypothetical protein
MAIGSLNLPWPTSQVARLETTRLYPSSHEITVQGPLLLALLGCPPQHNEVEGPNCKEAVGQSKEVQKDNGRDQRI